MEIKPQLRDIFALPFLFMAYMFLLVTIKVGSLYMAKALIDIVDNLKKD